jgi:hypothetical protein
LHEKCEKTFDFQLKLSVKTLFILFPSKNSKNATFDLLSCGDSFLLQLLLIFGTIWTCFIFLGPFIKNVCDYNSYNSFKTEFSLSRWNSNWLLTCSITSLMGEVLGGRACQNTQKMSPFIVFWNSPQKNYRRILFIFESTWFIIERFMFQRIGRIK